MKRLSRVALNCVADPLGVADKIAAFYGRLEGGHHAGLRTFLQYAYHLAVALARNKSHFRTLRNSEFWRGPGQMATPRNVMRATLYYVMRAASPQARSRAGKYAKLLTLFQRLNVPPAGVAQLIEDLGGVERILRLLGGRESCQLGSDQVGGSGAASLETGEPADVVGDQQSDGAPDRGVSLRDKCLTYLTNQNATRGRATRRATRPRLEDNVALSSRLFVNMAAEKLHAVLRVGDRIRGPVRAKLNIVIYPRDDSGWVAMTADALTVSPPDLAMASEPDDDFEFDQSGPEDAGEFALLR